MTRAGTVHAVGVPVAKTVEELHVYQRALAAAHEMSDLLERPAFQRDRELSSQLSRASVRVASDISEGFEQRTDRHFARYLRDSKGGTGEIRTQLAVAIGRRHITTEEGNSLCVKYTEIARMLSGLIRRLERDDWKDRR